MRSVGARLLALLGCLAAMSVIAFGLLGLMPGDPADLLIASQPEATPEQIDRLRKIHGGDSPFVVRYAHWLAALAQGDLGTSRVSHQPVLEVLRPALANSLMLSGLALPIAVGLALSLGLLAAWRADTWLSRAIAVLAHISVAVPGYWLGLLLIHVFGVKLGLLPSGGLPDPASRHLPMAHFVLPVLTLVILAVGPLIGQTRAAIESVLGEDFIRTARAKGLSERRVAVHHGLRNAARPIVTCIGLSLGELVSGAVLVETIFAWPGMGRLLIGATVNGDYNVAVLALLLITATVVLAGALGDLVARALDPRPGRAGGRA